MNNVNYVGSLAERFIQFRSGIEAATEGGGDIFNSVAVYVPSVLVADNLTGVDAPTTPTTFTVKKVTYDNYAEVLKGELLRQWGPIFRDGDNVEAALIVVVFYVPDGSGTDVFTDYLTVGELSIVYTPLSAAFAETYVAAFWKVMFDPNADGATGVGDVINQYYFDLSLALAQLCLQQRELSYHLAFVRVAFPLLADDTGNVCKIASINRSKALADATALNMTPTVEYLNPRANLFIGMLNLLQASNTWVAVHSEKFNVFSEVLALMLSAKNESGTFIGNKIAKIRLTGENIKPTGVPSVLDDSMNANLPIAIAERLDSLFVSYLISLTGDSGNNAMLVSSLSVTGTPVLATAISRWVDYTTSKTLALLISSQSTLQNPILKNATTYELIQNTLLANLQRFAKNGRLVNISLNFPQYVELPASPTDIVVSAAWTAEYVSDIGKIVISGTVVV